MKKLLIVLLLVGCDVNEFTGLSCRWKEIERHRIPDNSCAIAYATNGASVSADEPTCNERVTCMTFGPGETLVWSTDKIVHSEQSGVIMLVSCDELPECPL